VNVNPLVLIPILLVLTAIGGRLAFEADNLARRWGLGAPWRYAAGLTTCVLLGVGLTAWLELVIAPPSASQVALQVWERPPADASGGEGLQAELRQAGAPGQAARIGAKMGAQPRIVVPWAQ
jgi:hypothetical protein